MARILAPGLLPLYHTRVARPPVCKHPSTSSYTATLLLAYARVVSPAYELLVNFPLDIRKRAPPICLVTVTSATPISGASSVFAVVVLFTLHSRFVSSF